MGFGNNPKYEKMKALKAERKANGQKVSVWAEQINYPICSLSPLEFGWHSMARTAPGEFVVVNRDV